MRPSPGRSFRSTRLVLFTTLVLLLAPAAALAQANGKLQIHHMKVGQGDGILLISPNGQTALFDDGVYTNCTYIKSYLQGLAITVVDYHFASHYHADHIGCIDDLAAIGITIGTTGYDRGSSYSSATYTNYVNTLGPKRATIAKNQTITLDAGAPNPVTIKCVDLNGAGVYSPSGSDENAKSVVLKVSYGAFDEVIGGDLTGSTSEGNDVESTIGPECGDVEVYKAHHHGSAFSTNDNWLAATTPEVAIIQVGSNSYGHPTAAALGRLHAHGVKTYWTETGAGASPDPQWDEVAGETVVVEADPGANDTYTVSGPGFSDTYTNGGGSPPVTLNETLVATSMTMIKGSITTGDVTRLAVNDAVRVSVGAGVDGGKYLTDWYGSVTLAHPPTALTITYDGNYTVSRTQTLYLWNWTTSAWVQIDQASVGTTDVTRTWSTTSPAAYVSGTREVRLRVASNKRNSSFTCRGDYMAFNYDYLQGTITSPALEQLASLDPNGIALAEAGHDAEPEHRLPTTALTRIEAVSGASGVVLTWATDANAHLDGFNVYRETPDGVREFVGGEAVVGLRGNEVVFSFSEHRGAGAYWLGARSCSGPEGLIGPIRVSAAALGATLELAPISNPSRGTAAFRLTLSREAEVKLAIFDLAGRHIATPFAGRAPAGETRVAWSRGEAGRISPGVYFASLEGLGQARIARVVIVE